MDLQRSAWCWSAALLVALALQRVGVAQDAEPQPAPAPAEAAAPDRGYDSISIEDLREHVATLASDQYEGRAAGTKGNDLAATYIQKHFAKLGLEKVASRGKSWFQPFDAESPRYKTVATKNVLGLLRGTDQVLREQVVIIGAHFDHVGVGAFGSREAGRSKLDDSVHNGADDNASGTSGMLELAEAFALAPPRRSILFLAFSAEELGLLGSYHYCKEPALPLEQTIAMFNFDMIGRSEDDYLFVGGVGTSPAWDELIRAHIDSAGLQVERGPGGKAPSDNTPFYEKCLPVLFFFTNVHVDYHRVSDHADFLNYGTQAKILRAAYRLIRTVADADTKPTFRTDDGSGMPATMDQLMQLPSRAQDLAGSARTRARERVDKQGCGRLGFAPASAREGELMIGEILSEGPAATAGLDAGDVVLSVDGKPIKFSKDVADALGKVKAGAQVTLSVRRDGKTADVVVVVGK